MRIPLSRLLVTGACLLPLACGKTEAPRTSSAPTLASQPPASSTAAFETMSTAHERRGAPAESPAAGPHAAAFMPRAEKALARLATAADALARQEEFRRNSQYQVVDLSMRIRTLESAC